MSDVRVRVLIVDDQVLVRRSLAKLLEFETSIEVVGQAGGGEEALAIVQKCNPAVVLVDARMPGMSGVELVQRLTADHPGTAAVILTTFDDNETIFGGLRAGARGYLLKDTSPEELVAAIHRAGRGETVLDGHITARVVAEATRAAPVDVMGHEALSEREMEVAGLVGNGASNREIARALFISEGTARNHVSKILRKLELRDRTRLAIWAAQHRTATGRPRPDRPSHREGW